MAHGFDRRAYALERQRLPCGEERNLARAYPGRYFMGETFRCRPVRYCDDDWTTSAVLGDCCDGKTLRRIANRNRALGPDRQRSKSPVPVGQRKEAGEGGPRARRGARVLLG